MTRIYFLIFWAPLAASLVMLLMVGREGVFQRPGRLWLIFLFAGACQIVGQAFSPVWTIGLVVQSILAIAMAIKIKLDF